MGIRRYAAADSPAEILFGEQHFVDRIAAAQASFLNADLYQLHQWQLWLEERGETWPRLPSPFAERCRAAISAEEGNPSRFQRKVASVLAALELQPREEVRTAQGYSLDAVVSVDRREVAVEVDVPTHFVATRRRARPCSNVASFARPVGRCWPCHTGSGTRSMAPESASTCCEGCPRRKRMCGSSG